MNNNHFKIIIPLYNCEKYIKQCIENIQWQTYDNFQCIVVDDISTDNSLSIIMKTIGSDIRFRVIANTEKKFALQNIYEGILESKPNNEDIIITVDGDDWLADDTVLEKLNTVYSKSQCWLTYGSYMEYPSGQKGKFSVQIPDYIIENNLFRENQWMSSHLRTFKYHLWKQIKVEDMLDSEGKFYKSAWDLAFMFPMLEMAGHRSKYISDILYVYRQHEFNDHQVNHLLQLQYEREIRGKQKYNLIIEKE